MLCKMRRPAGLAVVRQNVIVIFDAEAMTYSDHLKSCSSSPFSLVS